MSQGPVQLQTESELLHQGLSKVIILRTDTETYINTEMTYILTHTANAASWVV